MRRTTSYKQLTGGDSAHSRLLNGLMATTRCSVTVVPPRHWISSTQRAVCYGVVVDNVSNDGTFQLAVPD